MNKFGGVREFKTVGGVSGESHVSVKEKMSIEFSEINSCQRRGLLQESVIEVAERMLR